MGKKQLFKYTRFEKERKGAEKRENDLRIFSLPVKSKNVKVTCLETVFDCERGRNNSCFTRFFFRGKLQEETNCEGVKGRTSTDKPNKSSWETEEKTKSFFFTISKFEFREPVAFPKHLGHLAVTSSINIGGPKKASKRFVTDSFEAPKAIEFFPLDCPFREISVVNHHVRWFAFYRKLLQMLMSFFRIITHEMRPRRSFVNRYREIASKAFSLPLGGATK